MSEPLFDPDLRPLRRARAERMGADYFLHERAFDDCLDRIETNTRRFRSALLFGPALPGWRERLMATGIAEVIMVDPASNDPLPHAPDLCLSIGALDGVDELPALLGALRHLLAPDALFIGALAGGNSLPTLRQAMQAADLAGGHGASAHVHPRIDPSSFAALLANAGFVEPVVDLDRVTLRYDTLDAIIRDLRAMAATNCLRARPRRPILRTGLAAARAAFDTLAIDGRSSETVELIHFAAWTPTNKKGATTSS